MNLPSKIFRASPGRNRLLDGAALLLGMLVTATLYGYQFGRSNQAVYLLDGLHRADPSLLTRDWFTTQTLQYHVAFSLLVKVLFQSHSIQPAFVAMYGVLIALFHFAWFAIVRQLGGNRWSYLVAVTLYTLSAAGTGLGMYQFFQDGSLLPSNIANVLLLAGIAAWGERRLFLAAICFGVAGVFHLNHALVGSALWFTLSLSLYSGRGLGGGFRFRKLTEDENGERPSPLPSPCLQGEGGRLLLSSILAIFPSVINVTLAAHAKLARSGAMSLADFVDLYVRLRHPHHYQPSSWPIGIWIAFGWACIAALYLLPGTLRLIALFFSALIAVALLGAGVFYVSETLVQLSLFRFSIYVQLLGCCAVAVHIGRHRWISGGSVLMMIAAIMLGLMRGPYFGTLKLPKDDEDYRSICRWVASNTPTEALFIVPPDEESMRLVGQRAIIVNFKGVPQLSGELVQWRQRLCDLLNLPDLQSLPRGYVPTLTALRQRYDQLTPDEYATIARNYQADYLLASHALPGWHDREVPTGSNSHYALYDLRDLSSLR